MPRKPNPPPALLRIERLSDGQDPTLVDDFTNEPLAQPHARPPKVNDAIVHRDAQVRAKAKAQRAMLRRVLPQAFRRG